MSAPAAVTQRDFADPCEHTRPIASLEERNSELNDLLPVFALPNETLSHIFEDAVAFFDFDFGSGGGTFLSDPFPLHNDPRVRISHVCRRWRSIALATLRMWGQIYANSHTPVDKLSSVLKRSKNVPIDLVLSFSSVVVDNLLGSQWTTFNAALHHSSHVRSLKIQCDSDIALSVLWPSEPSPVEILHVERGVTSAVESFPLSDVDRVYPRLRFFTAVYFEDIAHWRLPATLTKIHFWEGTLRSEAFNKFLRTLRALRKLEVLEILWTTIVGPRPSPLPEAPTVSLPSLSKLVLRSGDDDWFCALMLPHLDLPASLSSLEVYFDVVPDTAFMLSSLAVLGRMMRTSFSSLDAVSCGACNEYGRLSINIEGSREAQTPLTTKSIDIGLLYSLGDNLTDESLRALESLLTPFITDFRFPQVRTATFWGQYGLWLTELADWSMPDVREVNIEEFEARPGQSLVRDIFDMIWVNQTEPSCVPFPKLQKLKLINMDVPGIMSLPISAVVTVHSLPLGEVTIVLKKCRNVNALDVKILKTYVAVEWDGAGSSRT